MFGFPDRKDLSFVFLFLIVFLSRLPFLNAGYGVEEDSWGIAIAAFHTKLTGIYEPSRLPGHPFQEYIFSFLWGSGPVVFNTLCAFFSAVGAVFFALILRHLRFTQFFIAALAFAFVPVYYISSTYTIDFTWTQALVLIALYALLKEKYALCGLFLGLAIGCRITSGSMLLPFMIIIWKQNDFKANATRFFKISVPMALTAIVLFLPVMQQFGLSFFMYYDQFPYPPFTKVMYKMIIGVFGCIGTIGLLIASVQVVFNRRNHAGEGFNYRLDKKIIVAAVCTIVLYCISYFRLPQKSGYMIPVIPWVILLFAYYLSKRNFKLLCGSLLLSSFVFSINLTDLYRGAEHSKYAYVFQLSNQELFIDPFSGPIFSDYSKRQQKMAFTDLVIHKSSELSSKTVIIAGWWYNEIIGTIIPETPGKMVVYEAFIDVETMNAYRDKDYDIYYLPEQDTYNDLMYNMKVTDQYAKSFIE